MEEGEVEKGDEEEVEEGWWRKDGEGLCRYGRQFADLGIKFSLRRNL